MRVETVYFEWDNKIELTIVTESIQQLVATSWKTLDS